jgi:putative ABC transport system permease protein
MLLVESLVIATCAWLIGTLAIIPAVIGVSAGFLGAAVPPVAWTTYSALGIVLAAGPPLITRTVRTAPRSMPVRAI